jgi:hypothetical protein
VTGGWRRCRLLKPYRSSPSAPSGFGAPRCSLIGNATGPSCQTRVRQEPVQKLELKINPPQIKVPDNSKQGTPLTTITVSSNGVPFTGKVRLRLTKNQRRICQLVGMQRRLGRDTTKADDDTTSVRTVTAIE